MKKKYTSHFILFFSFLSFLLLLGCQKTSKVYLRSYNDIRKVYVEDKDKRANLFITEILNASNRDVKARYLDFLKKIINSNEKARQARPSKQLTEIEKSETKLINDFVKTNYIQEKDFNIKNHHLSILSSPTIYNDENLSFLISLLKNIDTTEDNLYHYQYLIKLLFVDLKKRIIKDSKINSDFVSQVTQNLSLLKQVTKPKYIAFFLIQSDQFEPKDFIEFLQNNFLEK